MGGRFKSFYRIFFAVFLLSTVLAGVPAKAEDYYVFSGTLKTSDNQLLGGFSFQMYNADNSFFTVVMTDENGAFYIETLADTYTVIIEGGDDNSGITPSIRGLMLNDLAITGNMTVDLVVPIRSLTVTVLDNNSQPVPNARVAVYGEPDVTVPFELYTGGGNSTDGLVWRSMRLTDEQGQTVLPIFPAAGILVYVYPDDASGLPGQSVLRDMLDNTTTTITLADSVVFSGTVKDSNGMTLGNLNMAMEDFTSNTFSYFTSDENGAFSTNILAGTYSMRIEGGDQNYGTVPSIGSLITNEVVINQDTQLNLVVPVRSLSITVSDPSGQPLANAQIIVQNSGPGTAPFALFPGANNVEPTLRWRSLRVTDSMGLAVLPVIPATGMTVNVWPDAASGLPIKSVVMDMLDDTAATINYLPTFVFNGTLKDSDAIPLANYQIDLRNDTNTSYELLRTDENGAFTANLPAGTFSLTIYGGDENNSSAPYLGMLTTTGIVISADTTKDLVIPVRQLTLTVEDFRHNPLPNTNVILESDWEFTVPFAIYEGASSVLPSFSWRSRRLTDANGQIVIPFIPTQQAKVTLFPDPSTGLNSKIVTISSLLNDTSRTIRFKRAKNEPLSKLRQLITKITKR